MEDEQEYLAQKEALDSSEGQMNILILIPTIFQAFLSVGMELLWAFLCCLQLVANIKNLKNVILPAPT